MNDKIIRFPGRAAKPVNEPPAPVTGPDGLDEDQRKAMGCILAGMPFVFVAIKPTDDGADFFTALHGDPTDLRNAQPHLEGVIARLYDRRGL